MTSWALAHTFVVLAALQSPLSPQAKGLGFSVEVEDASRFSATLRQVRAANVLPGGPADLAGLQAGDIITELNGYAVGRSSEFALTSRISDAKPGERVRMVVLRGNGTPVCIEVVAGS